MFDEAVSAGDASKAARLPLERTTKATAKYTTKALFMVAMLFDVKSHDRIHALS